ncbi:hypothetical protein LL037_12435 [Clostridium estertheticum]|uniref:Uncharacterized protein n=1 Tax=Clostridium estertheticum TaxID=238834 RepID=A0AA47ELW6_9CLOT|nr:hypothetical protein [Clostridium estertheticum]MBU3156913.1 hypothetical protein [Clostridium estertheticum]MBU3202442.1 hypothetical protein [Clostridium estertheticum]MBX4262364.1 hypothetical protein [Clostridium estertheticum]MCB2356408.1 hypothetical protein [Clostridium estertheticum]WAG39647.1 hypothetical protein LL065_15280 [Clostridium estertheticum]
MSDDKMFEFMTKMYSEMQESFKDIKNNDKIHTERFDKLETRLGSLENEVKKIGVKIDGKLIPTSVALLDGYKGNSEHITIIDDKIDRLQIDVNSISMKVSYNDSRIIEISKNLRKVE